ncbi:hypothetical protein HPB47_008894 [Ixodes persulcatus]|uniref:Uncharacterized protein n=1 Tax=Ixodes persulcatus TaxID=34615 RepID=A0AC60P3R9_IXOPE|nr:hypothetical protein HPB47_008894 [Ixodes persulcatus]
MMGMLENNESDLALSCFLPTFERLEVALPTVLIVSEEMRILGGRLSAQSTNIFGYIMTFDWQVWMAFLMALFLLSGLSTVVNIIRPTPAGQTKLSLLSLWNEQFWKYLENMLTEASAESPGDTPSRILSAVWWMAVIVLMNAFTGHMRACMMIKSQTDTIDSLAELVTRTQVKPYVWGGTAYVFMLRDTGTPEYQSIWRSVERHRSILPTEKLYSRDVLNEVMEGKAVIVSDRSSLVYKFKLVVSGSPSPAASVLGITVARAVGAPRRRPLGLEALVEGGFTQRWWDQGVGTWRECGGSSGSQEDGDDVTTSHTSLQFQDLRAVFVLWLCSACIATAVFVLEGLLGVVSRKSGCCRVARTRGAQPCLPLLLALWCKAVKLDALVRGAMEARGRAGMMAKSSHLEYKTLVLSYKNTPQAILLFYNVFSRRVAPGIADNVWKVIRCRR